jgi:zinc-binding alcohol dehydrogenase/oxidoreductase
MKALVISEKNKPPVWQEVPDLVAGPGEAIVRVHAAALNHRDVWIQRGQYAGLKYPIVLGSDGAGVVTAVGQPAGMAPLGGTEAGVDEQAWIGKAVIIDPALYWGGQAGYQDPTAFRILGLPDDGTMAEYVKVPVENLVEKPAHLSFEEAAALPLAGVTAYRALFTRAQVRRGERVLITGIGGGVALFALQYAVAAGIQVFVSSGSDEKLERAKAMGAMGGVNYKNPGWVEEVRKLGGGGFDVILDGAGGDGFSDLLDLCLPGGRMVLYGATRGNPSNIVLRRIFWKQLNVLGSTMGSPEDFAAMVGFVSKQDIRPVVDSIFPPEDGEAAFELMEEGGQFGKIVISLQQPATYASWP